MLTKSQARLFFVGGTIFFSAIFLALTVDTLGRVDERQNLDLLTPEVARGKHIWDSKNCMGCHTILGEGAYYAPELTQVVARRGAEWIAIFLKDPEAMFPGKRRMTNFHFSDQEISDVIAFLGWIGKIDTNGFPPEPDLRPEQPVVAAAAAGVAPAPAFFQSVCVACHAVAGQGGVVGPSLDGVGSRLSAAELDRWLADPPSVRPGTAMPNLNLPDETRAELVAWLVTLK